MERGKPVGEAEKWGGTEWTIATPSFVQNVRPVRTLRKFSILDALINLQASRNSAVCTKLDSQIKFKVELQMMR